MSALASHFVGRSPELQHLEDALDQLAAEGAGAVEIVGAAGIGKTRLLGELAARADARGHIVLTGSGADLERDLPFWVFVDALDEYVASVELRRLANLDEDVRSELAHVFPSLTDLGRGGSVGLQDERYRTNRAVRELLERLAATKPLVLILDDVHWADPASVDLLASLLHRPPDASVLIALGVRASHGPPRLTGALDRAVRDGELTRIELDPLTNEEAAALLGHEHANPSTEALYHESGGNPFYLEQLARTPASVAPSTGDVSVPGVQVPALVAAALTEELAQLSEGSRRVLDGASVAGDPFEPELAAAAAGVTEEQAIEALDELLERDLVRLTTVPRRFRFRHPIVRRAVYEATPGGWRIGAHERTAAVLADRRESAGVRAHHVENSAKVGDDAAIATLAEAGRQSAQRAPATAARWFTAALRLLPDTAQAEQRVDLLLPAATALAATGRFAEAHDALLESLEIVPGDATPARIRLAATCARVEHLLGLHDEAHARLTTALDSLPDASGPEAVALMLELAADAVYRLQYESGQERAAQAVAAAREIDDPALLGAALATLARAFAWGGDTERGEATRTEAAALIDALSDEQLAGRLDAAVELAGSEIYLDRFVDAGAHAERALAVGRATGQGQLFPGIYATLGVAWTMVGRLREATDLLETATEAARLTGNPQALAWALFCRAFVAVPAGDNRTAIAAAQESLDLARDAGQHVIAARAASILAVTLLDAGEQERASRALAEWVGNRFALIPDVWRTYLLELLTRCWLALGRRADAEGAAAGAESSAAAVGLRLPAAMAGRAIAAVALDAGDAAVAAERALESAGLADAVGAPVEAGLARTLAGRALAAMDERERAVEQLERAVADLDGCGAIRYRDAAERELRQLGQRVHRRSRPGDLSQTGVGGIL